MQRCNFISVWDLDNCLFDDTHRVHLIDWAKTGNERYDRYDAEMAKDPVAHQAEWLVMTAVSQPIFITGRRERWRKITEEQISKNLRILRNGGLKTIGYPIIFMRPEGDASRPVDLKHRIIMKVLEVNPIDRIIAAFDDVESIVDMYRELGLPGVLLRVNDPKHTYGPNDL